MAREYRDSGIEWIGQIPKEWDCAALLRSLKGPITDGPHETPVLQENGIPFISVDSLNDTDRVDLSVVKKFISRDLYEEYKKKANIEEGDILFSKAATIGKTAIVRDEVFMVWSPLAIIKPSPRISFGKYMYYVLNCDGLIRHVSFLGTYNTQINVGMRALEKAIIPMPSVVEQQKIADYLDKVCGEIDEMVAIQETMIEELKAYKQSVITEAVTKGLSPNVSMRNSGIDWIGEIPEHWEVIRIKHLLNERKERSMEGLEEPLSMSQKYGLIPTKEMDMIPNIASSFVGAKLVYQNDLVFNKLKAHLGVFSVSDYDGLVSPDYAVYFSIGKANVKYLEYLFKTPQYIGEFIKLSSGVGAGLTRLYTSDLYSIKAILPPIDEQNMISAYIVQKSSEIDSLIALKQAKIEELKEYKKSVIYEYVTGKKEVC